MISHYNKIYSILLPTLLKVLIFFLPLVFWTGGFEFTKTYFLYILGSTIIVLFASKAIINNQKLVWPNKYINWFLISYVISTLLSSHFHTSLWGYYTRFNGSLISILVLYGLFVVLLNELSNYELREIAVISALAVIPISIYALAQHYGFDITTWENGAPSIRATSTFGQPNWLAAFLAMLMPTILSKALSTDIKYDGETNFLWAGIFTLSFCGLWLTFSLSGLLGFVVGILFFLVLNKEKISDHSATIFIISVLCLTFAYYNQGIFKEKIQDLIIDTQKIYREYIQVQAQQENLVSDPGFIRSSLWKGTIDLALSSPKNLIIGTGPETFAYEFQKFRPLGLNNSSEWDFIMNKPHNYYLEIFSAIGLFGLIPYLIIISGSIREGNQNFTPGLVAFYITNIFSWPTVATAFLFWVFLAGIEKEKYV